MSLPQQLPWDSSSNLWAQKIDPVIANNIVKGAAVNGIALLANTPKSIPTTLSRMQLGWFITDINASAAVWRSSSFTNTTLTLTASANCTVNIWMY